MKREFKITRALVRKILEHAHEFEWSLQGLGMLRLYLDDARLHVWDHSFAWAGNSAIHDHSWDLRSTVISGQLGNTRYLCSDVPMKVNHSLPYLPYWEGKIIAGYNVELLEKRKVWLSADPPEVIGTGEWYTQRAEEIHLTRAVVPGTVTIMERVQGDPDAKVHVFWPVDEEWQDAKPRPATAEEVRIITGKALLGWHP